jgi:undecaprenyl-diphosphatase
MGTLTQLLTTQILPLLRDNDIMILKWVTGFDNHYLRVFLSAISDSTGVIAFGCPVLLWITAKLKHNKHLMRQSLFVFISVALAAIVANIIKYTVNLPRPYEVYPFIEKLSSGGSPSFPSGHTADAFALFMGLLLAFKQFRIYVPALLWACCVGFSRMNLGVHFPSDVLAGILIGLLAATLVFGIRSLLSSKTAIGNNKTT